MRKITKMLSLLLVFVLFAILVSCSGEKKLEKALAELNEESYTINGTMTMDMKMTMDGETMMDESATANMIIECNPTDTYTETTTVTEDDSDSDTSYYYAHIDGTTVKSYSKYGDYDWELLETVDLEDYSNYMTDMLDIDAEIKDIFTKDGDVWSADPEAMTTILNDYLNVFAEEMAGTGATIDKMEVTKYEITLDKKHVSKLDYAISLKVSMTEGGYTMTMEMNMAMVMNISKIGETTVTTPENLPTE